MSGTTDQAPRRVQDDVPAKAAHDTVRKALLAAGVLSSLLYVVGTDVFAAAQWDDYSRTQEMVSKLFAVGSPSRGPALIVLVGGAYSALMIAFGFGVWASAHRNRALRVTGALLIAYGQPTSWGRSSRWTSGQPAPRGGLHQGAVCGTSSRSSGSPRDPQRFAEQTPAHADERMSARKFTRRRADQAQTAAG